MKRRTFIVGLAALVPVAALGWWRRRRAQPASRTETRPAASAVGATRAASSAEQIRYIGGLPLRTATPSSLDPECREALGVARTVIREHCTNLDLPNAAIHGVRALGRDLALAGGDTFRVVLERYTQERYVEGRVVLEVPVRSEGHRHAMLKTLVEKQCDLDFAFEHEGRPYRFRDYVESARLTTTFDATEPLDELSWSIIALARVTPADRTAWTNLHGHRVDLDAIVERTSSVYWDETQLVREVDLDAAEVPRTCAAFGRVCGGLHMLYAFAVALSCGHTNPQRRSAYARHMQTLVRRFRYDLRVIEQVERLNASRVGVARAALTAFDARLKFLGHAFEIVGITRQFELHAFTENESAQLEDGRRALCRLLAASAAVDWPAIRADQQLYDSVVGGLCHAYNGLLMSAV